LAPAQGREPVSELLNQSRSQVSTDNGERETGVGAMRTPMPRESVPVGPTGWNLQ